MKCKICEVSDATEGKLCRDCAIIEKMKEKIKKGPLKDAKGKIINFLKVPSEYGAYQLVY